LTWLGNSTKSRGVFAPERDAYRLSASRPCSAWPNSWNIVITSSQVIAVVVGE
jgi:hypothetical protein